MSRYGFMGFHRDPHGSLWFDGVPFEIASQSEMVVDLFDRWRDVIDAMPAGRWATDDDTDDSDDEYPPYDDEVTPVFFALLNDEVIAVMPFLPHGGRSVTTYMHVGQHGGGDLALLKRLPRATPRQFAALYWELAGIGYNLEIIDEAVSSG